MKNEKIHTIKYWYLETILPKNKGKIIGTSITFNNQSPGKLNWKEITELEYFTLIKKS